MEEALRRTVPYLKPLAESLGEFPAFAFARSPETVISRERPVEIDRLLDADIDSQSDDGGWWPTWEWGQYEDTWPVAEREWAGKLTLYCLVTLDSFGKIAR